MDSGEGDGWHGDTDVVATLLYDGNMMVVACLQEGRVKHDHNMTAS